ncbi:MAG: hypothetical protein ACRDNO_27485 [Trebonia sp.]
MAIPLGIIAVIWLVALAVSVTAEHSATGKAEAGVLFGAFLALTVGALIVQFRSRTELQVSHDTIVHRAKKATHTFSRSAGESLRVLPRFVDHGLARAPRLTILGSGGILSLEGFAVPEIRSTCEAHGWRFDDDDPGRAAADVQRWLHAGRSPEATQLIQLFGPFTSVPVDDDPAVSLDAAVYEDYGDKLMRRAPSAARDLYRRAAKAQHAFAGHAPSLRDRSDRLAQAERIEGKAQG